MRIFLKQMRRRKLSRVFPIVLFLLASFLQIAAQQDDKGIEAIRRLSKEVNEQIEESERVEEGTGIYCNELVVNKGDKSWPAVGIYRTVIKFYYTFGDREKNPYPNRLLKINVTTRRSDRHEYAEYLFNPAEQLIFYYEKDGESSTSEWRYYFASERLIRSMTGQRIVNIKSRAALKKATIVINEKKKLRQIFLNSLGS